MGPRQHQILWRGFKLWLKLDRFSPKYISRKGRYSMIVDHTRICGGLRDHVHNALKSLQVIEELNEYQSPGIAA